MYNSIVIICCIADFRDAQIVPTTIGEGIILGTILPSIPGQVKGRTTREAVVIRVAEGTATVRAAGNYIWYFRCDVQLLHNIVKGIVKIFFSFFM